jgi:hypothetical protein
MFAVLLACTVALFCFFPGSLPPNSTIPICRGFVSIVGTHFLVAGKPFRFVGANVAVMYKDEDRQRLPQTLREATAPMRSGEGQRQAG